MNRYHRQIILKDFGETAQQKLLNAKVLVIGAGGLGCPALQYLAGAGVGYLTIVDYDLVTLTNLHRQILFTMTDIGKPKADVAAQRLSQLNPDIKITAIHEKLSVQNVISLMENCDYVLDGSDNFTTRYLINDACVLLNKPLIYGAVSQYEGQVAVLNVKDENGEKINYRDIFPVPAKPGEIANCAVAGVIGVLPGIIGTMQAAEVVKLITGIGNPLKGKLLTYNLLTQETYTIVLNAYPGVSQYLPATTHELAAIYDEVPCTVVREVNTDRFAELANNNNATIVDVRELNEGPAINAFRCLHIPMSQLEKRLHEIAGDKIIFVCKSGVRSKRAAAIYMDQNKDADVYSLKGGIVENSFLCEAQSI